MRNSVKVLLMASCVLLGAGGVSAKDKGLGVGVSIGGNNGINASVGLGTKSRIAADVDASIGGNKGVKADIDASIGGKKGLNADIDTSIGGDDGTRAKVSIGLGLSDDMDGNVRPSPDVSDSDDKARPGRALTSSQRQAFNAMSDSEKKALLKRCNSVNSGGYDAALVNLCKLLRMSASR